MIQRSEVFGSHVIVIVHHVDFGRIQAGAVGGQIDELRETSFQMGIKLVIAPYIFRTIVFISDLQIFQGEWVRMSGFGTPFSQRSVDRRDGIFDGINGAL